MTWVLIVAILSVDGSAITTQEFSSKENCLAAKVSVEKSLQARRNGYTKTECVKK